MLTTRSFGAPLIACLIVSSVRAQEPSLDQVHPRTSILLGLGIGSQDFESNTGNINDPTRPMGVISRSTDAFHIRARGEHYFERKFGVFIDGYIGIADDIDEDLGSTDSSLDSFGVFLAGAYRATMGESFRLPVRVGPFFQKSEFQNSAFTDGTVERSLFGVKLSAEPEFILMQSPAGNGKVSELSAFVELACGAGPAKVKDDVADEDAYAFTFTWEAGLRYRFPMGLVAGISYFAQKNHIGTTESYENAVFFGVDDDFTGVMITAGLRF